jgi:hypothetical protein
VRLKVSGVHTGSFVPEGHPAIARRFNAGEVRKEILVPEGRLRTLLALSRPFGTDPRFRSAHPALKRRAILGSPFGAKRRRELTDTFNRTPDAPWAVAMAGVLCYDFCVSTAELKRIVDDATVEEQQFLFACLSEKLQAHSQEELKELDRRLANLDAGKKRLSLDEFERRLDQG